MSNIKIKVAGVWKDSPAQFLKVAGVWKPVVDVYTKIAGIWKCVTCTTVVYDAYVIGGSLGSNITISPFMQSDGVTEEASMQGIDFLDGVERSLIIKYQAGVTDAHIDVNAPFNLAVDFSSNYVVGTNIEPMFNLADSPFKGEWVIQVVASGVEVRVKYDSVKGKLYTDWS